MHDLRINIFLELRDGVAHAPNGPGWYLDVRRKEGYEEIAPRVHLTPKDAEKIGLVLDKLVEGKILNYDATYGDRINKGIREAVIEANQEARKSMAKAIETAERAAQRLAELRIRLGEFDDAS